MTIKKEREEAKTTRQDVQSARAELNAEWYRRLANLRVPDARKRVEAGPIT